MKHPTTTSAVVSFHTAMQTAQHFSALGETTTTPPANVNGFVSCGWIHLLITDTATHTNRVCATHGTHSTRPAAAAGARAGGRGIGRGAHPQVCAQRWECTSETQHARKALSLPVAASSLCLPVAILTLCASAQVTHMSVCLSVCNAHTNRSPVFPLATNTTLTQCTNKGRGEGGQRGQSFPTQKAEAGSSRPKTDQLPVCVCISAQQLLATNSSKSWAPWAQRQHVAVSVV